MSQTNYDEQTIGYAGMKADAGPDDVASYLNEDTLEIPFGACVVQGTADNQCELPDDAADIMLGVAVHSHDYDDSELGTTGAKTNASISVMRKGRILVTTETAVVPGDRGFVRYASGAGGTQLGAWRNAAVASETIDATENAVFRSTAGAGELAVLEVDFTNKPA